MNSTEADTEIDLLLRKIEREQLARAEAERQLEDKSRELYLANEKVRDQFESLKATQGQLVHSEKMASVGQLAAGIAHEINNPIGFVTSNLQTLEEYIGVYHLLLDTYSELEEAKAAGNQELTQKLVSQIESTREAEDLEYLVGDTNELMTESRDGLIRVREIVQNLKSFVHLDQDEIQMADINEGLEATLKVVWNELRYKCKVEKNLGTLPQVQCYAGELNQVFLNLLINAAHSIEENGTITITTEATDSDVFIRVSDTGCGIPPENLERLFDPFFTTKPVGEGTGLGLSVSYGIVEKHGGEFTVQSEVGKGTTFTVRLPVAGPESNKT